MQFPFVRFYKMLHRLKFVNDTQCNIIKIEMQRQHNRLDSAIYKSYVEIQKILIEKLYVYF